ncbi:MAG: HEAT repeat domain-containing protein [Planctomycetota bacterium]|nr:HEAT repeat domain-containing protein [Planctomycetota bacterium]
MFRNWSRVLSFIFVFACACSLPPICPAEDDDPPEKIIKKYATAPMDQDQRETAIRKVAKEDSLEGMKILAPLLGDPFAHIHEVVIRAIDKTQNTDAIKFLAENFMLTAKEDLARANTARVLGIIGNVEAAKGLTRALTDRNLLVRTSAAEALGVLKSADAAKALTDRLKDPAPPVRYAAALALGRIGDASAQDALAKQLGDNTWEGRAGALAGLALVAPEAVIEHANKMLADKDYQVRIAAVEALFEAQRTAEARDAAFAGAVKALEDKAWQVRAAAIAYLVEIWEKRCIDPLIEQISKENGRLRLDTVFALKELTGADMGMTQQAWKGWWESKKEEYELPKERDKKSDRKADDKATTAAFCRLPIYSDRMMFILDLSGSMKNPPKRGTEDGTNEPKDDGKKDPGDKDEGKFERKIDIAAAEMENTIAQLPKEARFNVMVYRYYTAYPPRIEVNTAFKGSIQPAVDGNKKQAQAFVKKQEPLGWGAFFDAIVAAFEDPELDTIFLLSDGVPSRGTHVNSQEIVDAIVEMNRYRRIVIHTVMTGDVGTDAEFMRKLAAATGGMMAKR